MSKPRLLPFRVPPRRRDDGVPQPGFRQETDRKSTRLNSSHLVISYAVFCLKKKNRHELATRLVSLPRVSRERRDFFQPPIYPLFHPRFPDGSVGQATTTPQSL